MWSEEELQTLQRLWIIGMPLDDISTFLGRPPWSCTKRLRRLEIFDLPANRSAALKMAEDQASKLAPKHQPQYVSCQERREVKLSFISQKSISRRIKTVLKTHNPSVSSTCFFEYGDEFVLTLSSTEPYDSVSSPSLLLASLLFNDLLDRPDKPHLKRLKVGAFRVKLLSKNFQGLEDDIEGSKAKINFTPRHDKCVVEIIGDSREDVKIVFDVLVRKMRKNAFIKSEEKGSQGK